MGHDSPARVAREGNTINYPLQLTSFVGREREIAEVTRLLATTRLLTLTGAGGCGKTRLALRVADEVALAYPDGVWLVELAALADPILVPQAVASAIGVRVAPGSTVTDTLAESLRAKTFLVILDNCEHVVAAAARLVEALLGHCPKLRVVATSREALGATGETTWRVPSLAVPPDREADATVERLAQLESVRLFTERARAARPDFAVTAENAPAVAEVCRRLDGIPLALELAAARVRVFSVKQIAARLNDRFSLLTAGPRTAPPRQQTLRAALDWSYALLAEPERALLRRLSVFAGGWSFEAVEEVAAGDGIQAYALLDLLAPLVDKSLVIAEEQRGAVRYRLLETIRQYAHDRLLEAGEADSARERHLAFFLGLAEDAEPKLRGSEAHLFLDRLDQDHDNLRAALEWSLAPTRRDDAALRLSGALAWFWWQRSYYDEGRRWLERALAAAPRPSAARMKALHGAGWLAQHRRDAVVARALLNESLLLARALGDRWTVALALHHLGRVAYYEGDPAAARALGEQSLAVAEQVGDDWLIAWAVHLLGLAAHIAADYPAARAYYERSLAIRREIGYQEGIGVVLGLIGAVALREGELGQACALLREALAVIRAALGPWGLAPILAGFSRLAAAQGQPIRAVRLGAFAARLSESYHMPLIPLFEALATEGLAMAGQALGPAAYAAAWEEGRMLRLEDAVAEALAIEAAPAPAPPARATEAGEHGPFGDLTATEARVLRLLADGRTTKEIAVELAVAVSTVDRHITHIYQKLGVRNRAEATAAALKHGLV
jgi:non-specific serine/threonine protein kinase